MCEQETILEMIKVQPRQGGLTKNMVLLAEKQCKDYKKMEQRMTSLERKVDALDQKVSALDVKIDKMLFLVQERGSWLKVVKEILSNKVFLYVLVTLLCAGFGVSVGEVGTFLFK